MGALFQQCGEVLPPDSGVGVGAVAVGVFAGGDQDVFGLGDLFYFAFGDAEVGGIDEVVGGIDPHDRRLDFGELGGGIVIPRRGDLIEDVVGVEVFEAGGVGVFQIVVDGVAGGHLLLHLDGGAAGNQEEIQPTAESLAGLFGVVAIFPVGIAGNGVHGHFAPEAVASSDLNGQAGERHQGVHEIGIGFAPDEGVHAAHGGAGDEAEVVDAEAFGEQQVIGSHHVVVIVFGKFHAQAVAGLGGFSVTDGVAEDDEVFAGVEELTGAEEFAGINGSEELAAGAAGAVHDQNGVGDAAVRVFYGLAES